MKMRMGLTTVRGMKAAVLSVILINCDRVADAPVEPQVQTRPNLAVDDKGTTGGLVGAEMFSVSVDVEGQPRPGQALTVNVSVRALIATRNAELAILTPEIDAALLSSWDGGFRVPVKTTLPAKTLWAGALSAGETVERSVSLSVPTRGYYRITARVRDVTGRDLGLVQGQLPQSASEAEQWLFVDDRDGQVVDRFDASLIPPEYQRVPGPLRLVREASTGARPFARTMQSSSGSVVWQFLFFDAELNQDLPLFFASWDVEYREGGLFGALTGTEQGYTDLNGYMAMTCRPGERYSGIMQTWGLSVGTIPLSSTGFSGQFDQHCNTSQQAILTGNPARVYAHMSKVAYDANANFGFFRPRIDVEIKSNAENSFYSANDDKITIKTSHIPDVYGRFVIGHEYGHAYHHRAIGGLNPGYSDNCAYHALHLPSSYGCALSEGFADFFSAYLTGAYAYIMEPNIYHTPGLPPSTKLESAVAAVLYDVVDAANESHDAAEWTGSYLPGLVGTCMVSFGGVWVRASGVDHITYCLEQDIDYFATSRYVWERAIPAGWTFTGTTPGSWSKATARPLWLANIF